jgi:actin-related protein 6
MAPDDVMEGFFEIIFEYFNFDACIKSIPHIFTSFYNKMKYPDKINKTVQLVIDSGFSSTTIVPIFNNKPVYNAIKRVEISGKLMTNYLKECLSTTIDLDIRKEFFLSNLIKEETCFFSQDFLKDMDISKNSDTYLTNFILPEYRHKPPAFFENDKGSKFSIKMNNLRFIVPELLFNPNIIGIDAGGIHEGILSSINECHKDYKDLLYQNIITNGGISKIPGFNQRLCNELSNSVEYSYVKGVQIFGQEKIGDAYEEPVIEGMKLFAQNNEVIKDMAITRNDYDEIGFNIVWKTCL